MRRVSRNEKAVILLSGGIDSATTLFLALKYGYEVQALLFNYYQRHHKELYAAAKIAHHAKISYHTVTIHIPWVQSALTRREIHVPFNRNLHDKTVPITYVSGRNIIFLSYAASFAESIGAKSIFIGAHIEDYSGYPDCHPQFLHAMEHALNLGISKKGVQIVAPLVDKTKKEIIRLGIELGVPLQHTWSCYMGGVHPCQKCDSCRFRINAFKELGMNDPLLKN